MWRYPTRNDSRLTRAVRWGALAALAGLAAGCMPDTGAYQFTCVESDACPSGATCQDNCCVAPGDTPRCRAQGQKGDVGAPCDVHTDCNTGNCTLNVCAQASCSDGVKNGTETDRDCGGPCPDCGTGKGCRSNGDCISRVCTGGTCRSPSCYDGVRNGTETGVDCGGSCPATLYYGVCPGFTTQGCCSNPAVNIDGVCRGTIPASTGGQWFDTGMKVSPGKTYRTYNCSCGSSGQCPGCTAGTTWTTPSSFPSCGFCRYYYCTGNCTMPACPTTP